uniref:Uncharacterized protein n=1 Tax=Globodera rostochiensis TaxID=31243 RepID=A0A914HCE0_GLORO
MPFVRTRGRPFGDDAQYLQNQSKIKPSTITLDYILQLHKAVLGNNVAAGRLRTCDLIVGEGEEAFVPWIGRVSRRHGDFVRRLYIELSCVIAASELAARTQFLLNFAMRLISMVLLITFFYFSGRTTLYVYKSLSGVHEPPVTAVKLRESIDESDFIERIRQVIRDEVKELQMKERIKYAAKAQREISADKTSPAFSFRVHMNFSRLFDFL